LLGYKASVVERTKHSVPKPSSTRMTLKETWRCRLDHDYIGSDENATAGITTCLSLHYCLSSICCVTTERHVYTMKARGLSNSGLTILSSSVQSLSDRQYRKFRNVARKRVRVDTRALELAVACKPIQLKTTLCSQ